MHFRITYTRASLAQEAATGAAYWLEDSETWEASFTSVLTIALLMKHDVAEDPCREARPIHGCLWMAVAVEVVMIAAHFGAEGGNERCPNIKSTSDGIMTAVNAPRL